MNVVLLGPPGAGKGTLAGLLKVSLDLLHISTGDLLREEMKNNTKFGQEAKNYVEKGELVPDDLVTKLLANKLTTAGKQSGYMLDGYPRTKAQAVSLDKILTEIKKPLDMAIYMEASMDVIVQRISGRRIAPGSGAVYHIHNRPPKKTGICDVSGEKLIQRPDDNEETVRKRMAIYLENTLPIVAYYESRGILKKLNGDHQSEDLEKELMKIFNEQTKHN
ncbi:MAG: adenylate kinase [Candidatus Omnitrophica bacterium]|nr:adenylate kinase [Candidatus Omnitrophota bacterium]